MEPTFRIWIPKNKIKVLEKEEKDWSVVKVYMDGSAIEGGIGVVAVLFQGGIKQRVAWKYIGTMVEHIVFEAKLLGAAIGMKMLWQEGAGKHMIATDHQAAILTTREE